MRLEFGAYAQVFEDNDPSNTIRARSLGAIALNPTGNAQGDYFFMSLATGAKISRHQWTALPSPTWPLLASKPSQKWNTSHSYRSGVFVVEMHPDQPFDADEY
jgi:hypothetical protein